MSQIEDSRGAAALAGQLVFVATAARASVAGGGGVRSAMARAAQLLELDRPSVASAAPRHEATPALAGSLRAPARRRTRRYAERSPLVASR